MPTINNSQPSVAVCLAAFNGVLWLPEQLDGILKQTGVSVTLFVSVDQSTDGTEAWVDEKACSDSRIVVLPHGLRFGGAALNFFRILREVDFSGFDYVSFADQDDIWLPDKLLRAHQVLSSAQADAYSSDVTAFWPDGREVLIKKSQPQVQWDYLFQSAGPGCTYVMKTKLVSDIRALLLQHWEEAQQVELHDWLAYAYARAHGYRWVIDDYAGMRYRQHGKNQFGANAGGRAFVLRARKALSGWSLKQSVSLAHLLGLDQEPFVRHWVAGNRLGLLWLALHADQCRRRLLDKCLFACSCAILSLAGLHR